MHKTDDSRDRKRIAILGPGSIGCCIAAALQERGHDLVFLARTAFDRLQLDSPTGRLEFPAICSTSVDDLGDIDLYVVSTKAHQTHSAVPALLQAASQGKLLMNASIGAICVLARRNMDVLHDAQASSLALALI